MTIANDTAPHDVRQRVVFRHADDVLSIFAGERAALWRLIGPYPSGSIFIVVDLRKDVANANRWAPHQCPAPPWGWGDRAPPSTPTQPTETRP